MSYKVWTQREFIKVLNKNNYIFVRQKGSHKIFTNNKNTIAVPYRLNSLIVNRLIKENNLKI